MSAAWILWPNVFWGLLYFKVGFQSLGDLELETNTIHSTLKAYVVSSIILTVPNFGKEEPMEVSNSVLEISAVERFL